MLKKYCVASILSLAVLAANPLVAQQASQSQTEMPEVKKPAEGQGNSGLMSGEKPFTLMVDENVGELIYTFDEETKELESINAKRGVIFASEDMTLNADEMEYKTVNSSLVATGKRVVVRMGDMVITCQVFKYNPETQEGQFDGNPIVYQKDKEGKVTTTGGRTISVVNVNGKFQMRVGAGGGTSTFVRSSGTAANNQPLEKKTLGPGEKAATITLNNKPSGLAVAPAAPGTAGKQGSSGGIISMPKIKEPASAQESTGTSGNTVDPDNAADVKNLTEEKN